MNDQPHVRLVDAHAEGVGGGDGAQVAGDEAVLDVFLGFRRHGAVEESGLKALLLEEPGDFLGLAAGGAVDDDPARLLVGEVGGDCSVNVRQFVGRVGLDDDKLQVGASRAAVQVFQVDLQFLAEVFDYFRLDVGLGGGGQAEDRWYWPVSGGLLDESAHVAIVGPEVVTPLGEAVGFVQDPGAYLPLGQYPAHRNAAELLRGDDQDRGVAQTDFVQGVRPFGHGEQAVDGEGRTDALGLEAGDLVLHQGD